MIRSAHVDTFARDHLPAPEQWPDFLLNLPEVHYPDRLNCVSAFVDDWVAAGRGRSRVSDFAGRDAVLCRSCRAREPHRQCVDPRPRRRTRKSGAAARAEQSDDGGGVFRGHQSGRRRGRDDAASARQGDRVPRHQSRNPARAVRRAACRRNGKDAAARAWA